MSSPRVAIDVAGDPMVGPADAPIQIVLFSDFLCPWCRQVAEDIQQNFLKWNNKVAIHYKSFPLDKFCNPTIGKTLHAGSCWTALGGVCAQEQGKFWEYHDAVYAAQPENPTGRDVLRLAASAGLDTAQMKACMLQVSSQGKVRKLIKDAAALGVTGTPVIYINGHRLPRLAYFSYVLRRETERLGLPPLEGLDD
jgi:protein-disulfide isomerase